MGGADSPGSSARSIAKLVPILALAIIGGAVLPVAADFAQAGILTSSLIFVLVAGANVYTSDLLLKQAHATGCTDYELLAAAVGGRGWQLLAELSLQVLILGSVATAFSQVGELVAAGITYAWPDNSSILCQDSGRWVILLGIAAIAPASAFRHMHSLELLSDAGLLVVLALMIVVIVNSCSHGLPALRSGDFAFLKFDSLSDLTAVISDFGFMFYIQPIILPLLPGVRAGREGVRIVSWAVWIAILGAAGCVYYLTGFFGAARFGQLAVAKGNILDNDLGAGMLQGILNCLFAACILLAMAPWELASRNTTELWVTAAVGPAGLWWRWLPEALAFYAVTGGTAMLFLGESFKALTITGATGVALISYIIPITQHWLLFFGMAKCQRRAQQLHVRREQATSEEGAHTASAPPLGLIAPLLGEGGLRLKSCEAVALPLDLSQQLYSDRLVGPGLKHAYPCYAEASRTEVLRQTILPGMVLSVGVATGIIVLCTVW